ncbi:MAG: hypothetical protein HKN31_10395 [Pricia sp.]|nr:hypothetical protein [Pricia sp.]
MKLRYYILSVFFLCLFSSFKPNRACQYAESNIGYVKSETERAMAMEDIQLVRFHTYKALNAIEKSKEQLDVCGCEHAVESITEGSEHLKRATKTVTVAAARILLGRALAQTLEGLESLGDHGEHQSFYGNDVLKINTTELEALTIRPPASEAVLHRKIDSSLVKYKMSLDKVIATVNCTDARAFADRIYSNCEQQLLKPNLSDGKRYYNLKTKEITAKAIEKLRHCSQ